MGPIKPRREDRVVMSVNIKRSYRDWIDAIVKKQDISKSRFVESMFEVVQNVPPDFMVQLMDLSDKLNLPLSVVIGNTVLWRLIFLTTYQKVYGKPAPSTMQEFYIRKYTITDDKGKKEFQGIPTGEIAGQIFEMVLTEALEKDKEVRDELHATAEKARKRDLKIEDIPIVAEVIDNFLEHAING